MSRTPIHRARRCYLLWLPIIMVAAIVYFASFTQTLTLNGLGLIAMLVAFAGMTAIVKEGSTL